MPQTQEELDQLNQQNQPIPNVTAPPPVAPTLGEVKPEATVAGQVNSIIKQDSPLMQSARTSSKQQMNSKGLINSTMALQAGEKAVIDSALPIAQQDATTFYDQSKANQSAQNTFKQNEQAFGMNAALKNQEQVHALERMDVDTASKESLARLQNQLDTLKDANSFKLQEHLEQVKTNVQLTAQQKINYMTQASQIIDSTENAIKEIGLSGKTAAQQANAVQQMLAQRDSSIALLSSLLTQSNSWTW